MRFRFVVVSVLGLSLTGCLDGHDPIKTVEVQGRLSFGAPGPISETLWPESAGACRIGVIANPFCGGCAKLAVDLYEGRGNLRPKTASLVWFFEGRDRDVARFRDRHGLPASRTFVIASGQGRRGMELLDVTSTPTLFGVDSAGRIAGIIVSDRVGGTTIERIC